MKKPIDLEKLKSLATDYIEGFDGNADFLVRTVPELCSLLEQAQTIINGYLKEDPYIDHDCDLLCDEWLANFKEQE